MVRPRVVFVAGMRSVAFGLAQVLYVAENDTNLRRGQRDSPLA
jgi:hypothetical protein